jgi:hypothetical protein
VKLVRGERYVQRGRGIDQGTMAQRRAWALAADPAIVCQIVDLLGDDEVWYRMAATPHMSYGWERQVRRAPGSVFEMEWERLP